MKAPGSPDKRPEPTAEERLAAQRRRFPVFAPGQILPVGFDGTPMRVHSLGEKRMVLEAVNGVRIRRGRLMTEEEYAAAQRARATGEQFDAELAKATKTETPTEAR